MDEHRAFCSACAGAKPCLCVTSKLNAGPAGCAGAGRCGAPAARTDSQSCLPMRFAPVVIEQAGKSKIGVVNTNSKVGEIRGKDRIFHAAYIGTTAKPGQSKESCKGDPGGPRRASKTNCGKIKFFYSCVSWIFFGDLSE